MHMRSSLTVITTTFLALSAMAAAAEPAKVPKEAGDPAAIVPLKTAKLIIFEDFESTKPGDIPKGFTKKGSCSVVGDVAHSGMHALKLDAAPKGKRGDLWADLLQPAHALRCSVELQRMHARMRHITDHRA
jgi:hypothetical protein